VPRAFQFICPKNYIFGAGAAGFTAGVSTGLAASTSTAGFAGLKSSAGIVPSIFYRLFFLLHTGLYYHQFNQWVRPVLMFGKTTRCVNKLQKEKTPAYFLRKSSPNYQIQTLKNSNALFIACNSRNLSLHESRRHLAQHRAQ
jgi:hypothetical protein